MSSTSSPRHANGAIASGAWTPAATSAAVLAANAEAPRRGRRRGETTVAMIARLAGVSAPTVSKVLNGRTGVAQSTRRRVEAVLREHGYRRPGVVGSTPNLDVVFDELERHLAAEIMRGVAQVAQEHELAAAFIDLRTPAAQLRPWTDQVLARRPTGVIAVYSDITEAEQARFAACAIPLVALDPTGEPLHSVPSVGATNWSGGLAATRHLLDLGHRRIGVIAGPAELLCARARLDGYRAAMDAAGVPVDPDLVRIASFSFDGGLEYGQQLLAAVPMPTAIFCGNDLQALGVYEAARRAGLRIPSDLSVVGFDDAEYTCWCGPPMTTIRQPVAEMGAAAARLVLTMAVGEQPSQTRIELATSLVVRESTGPVRPGSGA